LQNILSSDPASIKDVFLPDFTYLLRLFSQLSGCDLAARPRLLARLLSSAGDGAAQVRLVESVRAAFNFVLASDDEYSPMAKVVVKVSCIMDLLSSETGPAFTTALAASLPADLAPAATSPNQLARSIMRSKALPSPDPVKLWYKDWVPVVMDREMYLAVELDVLIDGFLKSILPGPDVSVPSQSLTPAGSSTTPASSAENRAVQEYVRKFIKKPKDAHLLRVRNHSWKLCEPEWKSPRQSRSASSR
jgi:hypothetical protein